MYTLLNGSKVENLSYSQGTGNWLVSQWFWWNGKKVQEAFNTETGEIKWYDPNGNEVINIRT